MNIDLSGKNALVAGAADGLGRAIALALADAGADVACIAADEKLLAETAGEIGGRGRRAFTFQADIADPAQVDQAVTEAAGKLGSLDIVVNHAVGAPPAGVPEEDWHRVLDVSLKGPFHLLKAAGRTMIRQRSGSIINVTPAAQIPGDPKETGHSATLGGLVSLTKTAAREFSARGVRVNAVAPGLIETDPAAEADAKAMEQVKQAVPMNRPGKPEEVACAVVFLASDLASYVTGQVLVVDGGRTM